MSVPEAVRGEEITAAVAGEYREEEREVDYRFNWFCSCNLFEVKCLPLKNRDGCFRMVVLI